jgi:hypothetical protein
MKLLYALIIETSLHQIPGMWVCKMHVTLSRFVIAAFSFGTIRWSPHFIEIESRRFWMQWYRRTRSRPWEGVDSAESDERRDVDVARHGD